MTDLLNMFSGELGWRIGWMLLHSLWQATALAFLFAFTLLLIPRSRPNARYLAGCGALLSIALLSATTLLVIRARERVDPSPVAAIETGASAPVAHLPVPQLGERSAGAVMPAPIPSATAGTVAERSQQPFRLKAGRLLALAGSRLAPWLPRCTGLWLLGVIALGLWRLGGLIATFRLRRIAISSVSDPLCQVAARLGKQLRVNRPFRVLQSAVLQTPAVIGHLRPVVLLPLAAVTNLSTDELEAILAHELAHIRRHDFLINTVQTVIETLLFYHPAVWWISRRIRLERENCCDDLALGACSSRLVYAKALVQVQALVPGEMQFAAAASGGSLLGRIRRIVELSGQLPEASSRWFAGLLTLVLVVVITGCLQIASHSSPEQPRATVSEQPSTPRGVLVHFPKDTEVKIGSLGFVFAGGDILSVYDHANPHSYYRDGLWMHIKVRFIPQVNRVGGYEIRVQERHENEIVATVIQIDSQEKRGYGIYFAVKPGDTIVLEGGVVRIAEILSEIEPKSGERKVAFEVRTAQGTEKFALATVSQKDLGYCTLWIRHGVDERGIALEVMDSPKQPSPHSSVSSPSFRPAAIAAVTTRPAGPKLPARTLHFPADYSMGTLAIAPAPQNPLGGSSIGPAQGDVEIPADNVVGLWVDKDVPSLAPLAKLKSDDLWSLQANQVQVTDADLESIKNLTGLHFLMTLSPAVTDAGLAHVKGLVNLESLEMPRARVTTAGLSCLANLRKLHDLALWETQIDDRALPLITALPELSSLSIANTRITDAGLAALNLPRLGFLSVGGGAITSRGLEHLNAPFIRIGGDELTDDALAALARNPRLGTLMIDGTRITGKGFAAFKNHAALRDLTLQTMKLREEAMAYLPDIPNLTLLDLHSTPVTDAGLAHLRNCKSLRTLSLSLTAVSDEGLQRVAEVNTLERLMLFDAGVTDAGVGRLVGLPLRQLVLARTPITDEALKHIAEIKSLERLDLRETRVTDAGLARLAGLPRLRNLDVYRTQVTPQGVEEFKKKLNHPADVIASNGRRARTAGVQQLPQPPARVIHFSNDHRIGVISMYHSEGQPGFLPGKLSNPFPAQGDVPVPWNTKVCLMVDPNVSDLSFLTRLKPDDLQAIIITHAIPDEPLAPLAHLSGLEMLRLQADVGDAGLAHLRALVNLRELWLQSSRVTSKGVESLAGMTHLTNLGLAGTEVDDEGLAVIGRLPELKSLQILSKHVTDAGVRHLEKLHLERFTCSGDLSDAGVAQIHASSVLLDGIGEASRITDASLASLARNPAMKTITMARVDVTGSGFSSLKEHPALEELTFSKTPIRDDALGDLAAIPHLKKLTLLATQVTDAGLERLKSCKSLTYLDLAKDAITDAGVAWLAGMSDLEELILDETGVSDAGLAPLAGLTKLRVLSVRGTKVTQAGLDALPHLARRQLASAPVNPPRTTPAIAAGQVAPDFTLTTYDGELIHLADYRGRIVLLTFWSRATGIFNSRRISEANTSVERLEADRRFALLGVNMDATPRAVGDYADEFGINWPQACMGDPRESPVAKSYGAIGPGDVAGRWIYVLIGPDGKVLLSGDNIDWTQLENATRAALARLPVSAPAAGAAASAPRGALEFRIVANPPNTNRQPVAREYAGLKRELETHGPSAAGNADFGWFEIAESAYLEGGRLLPGTASYNGKQYLLLCLQDMDGGNRPAMLIVAEAKGKSGLQRAWRGRDARGRTTIALELDKTAGQMLERLTAANLRNYMAALIEGKIVSVATIRSQIGTNFEITGSFSLQQADTIVAALQRSR